MTKQNNLIDSYAVVNTDRETWREKPGDYYSNSIHVTINGDIGINVGGYVLVAPIREWHKAGVKAFAVKPPQERQDWWKGIKAIVKDHFTWRQRNE